MRAVWKGSAERARSMGALQEAEGEEKDGG
jgi:hypothetical protein